MTPPPVTPAARDSQESSADTWGVLQWLRSASAAESPTYAPREALFRRALSADVAWWSPPAAKPAAGATRVGAQDFASDDAAAIRREPSRFPYHGATDRNDRIRRSPPAYGVPAVAVDRAVMELADDEWGAGVSPAL